MSPQEIVTYGAGIMALVIVFGMVLRRNKSEQSVDDRAFRQLDDARELIRELQSQNSALIKSHIEITTTHGTQMLAAIEDAKQDTHRAVADLQRQLDDTKKMLADCQGQHDDSRRDVEQLRDFVMSAMNQDKK